MSLPESIHRTASDRRPHWAARLAGIAACLAALSAGGAINCNVSSGGVGFGDYDPLAPSPDDSTGNLSVTCTRQIFVDPFRVDYTLALSRGTDGGNFVPRRLSSGPNRLDYNLYTSAARSQVWGDGTNATGIVAGTASFNWFQTSQTNTHTAYGRLPALQDAVPGSYADTIVVTITF